MSTALYRRYRPETFAEVIGQEHVTTPLMQALRSDRVNHAYLFSGPRGCGKTTSARILARCLNCAQGPTDTPCGTCDSCEELARKGPGSLDVVEIDAASHGGVDDARELRERATFAPARDRFKIFIIDEAHMVTPQGFNALLKIVEEPPPHIKFVFATTEPDKVIGTIRSRTHHYPFHLVPPERLLAYLQELCEREDVAVGKGVLPLVVRAGGGSVRDSLSVLDQLVAGAEGGQVDYERAISLLGYTHAALLDDAVGAVAVGDGGTVFRVVDRVIESGHDPRRFVEDLLERLRDLIVLQAVGEGSRSVFRALPEDQLTRMQQQAGCFHPATLSRAADLCNSALTEMTGATSPRLHLELLCARILLPGAEHTERGLAARLDRLERRLSVSLPVDAAPGAPVAAPVPARPVTPPAPARPASTERPAVAERPAAVEPAAASERQAAAERLASRAERAGRAVDPEPAPHAPAVPAEAAAPAESSPAEPAAESSPARPAAPSPETPAEAHAGPAADAPAESPAPPPASTPAASGAGASAEAVRRMWPDVLDRLQQLKRTTWSAALHSQVVSVDSGVLKLGFTNSGALGMFSRGAHSELVRQALVDVLGLDVRVEPVPLESGAGGAGPTSTGPAPARAAASPDPGPEPDGWDTPARPSGGARSSGPAGGPGAAPGDEPPPPDPEPEPAGDPGPPAGAVRRPRPDAAPRAQAAGDPSPRQAAERRVHVAPEDDTWSVDDEDAEDSGMAGPKVVEELLGGRVIDVQESR